MMCAVLEVCRRICVETMSFVALDQFYGGLIEMLKCEAEWMCQERKKLWLRSAVRVSSALIKTVLR